MFRNNRVKNNSRHHKFLSKTAKISSTKLGGDHSASYNSIFKGFFKLDTIAFNLSYNKFSDVKDS